MKRRSDAEAFRRGKKYKKWVVTLSTGSGGRRKSASYKVRARTAERAIFAAKTVCTGLTGTVYGHARLAEPRDLLVG